MESQRIAWPSNIRDMSWPKTGITYSYENRGYIKPEKLQRWLEKAFGGRDKADYRVGREHGYKKPVVFVKIKRDYLTDHFSVFLAI
jgi:hypothetical protein